MVKKLVKHEFNYYFKTLIIFLPIMLLIGLSVRILRLFESDFVGYKIIHASSILLLYLASIAVIMYVTVLSLVRFYKNMYSQEGYLTFSLPASTFQLIVSKLIGSVCCTLITSLVVELSWIISGMVSLEISKELVILFNDLISSINIIHLILYCFELILIGFIAVIYSHILIYTCITIGQTAKKNRILLAVGAYFIYYILMQVIATAFVVIVTVFGLAGAFDSIANFIVNNPYTFFHLFFGGIILVYSGLIVLGYYIIQKIINNKLNLE